MARKFWFQKIDDPDAVAHAAARPVSDARIRQSTVLRNAGIFRDKPELTKDFLDANVPLALAMRAADAYSSATEQKKQQAIAGAGYTSKSQVPSSNRPESGGDGGIGTALGAISQANTNGNQLMSAGGDLGGGFLGWLGKGADAVGSAFKTVVDGVAEGVGWAVSHTVGAPARAGYANQSSVDDALDSATQGLMNVPVVGDVLGYPLATLSGLFVEPIVNTVEGIGMLAGGVGDQQARDIRRAGLDPAKVNDRYNYYVQEHGSRQVPVSDGDIAWLKGLGRYAPADVDAAREIVVTGALEDLTRSMPNLSARARDLILRSSSDPRAQELLEAVGDSSQTAIAGRYIRRVAPDSAPGDVWGPGSASRAILGGMGEVVATWHLDPTVLALKGGSAARSAKWTVNVADAGALDETAQMLKASDDAFKPKGALATRFDRAMDTADQIVLGLQKGTPEGAMEAGKLREAWTRAYPGYDKTLDILVGMRNGTVGKLRTRQGTEQVKDAQAAASSGRPVKEWMIDAVGDGSPLWRFTDADGAKLTDEARALERAKVADELSTFIVLDALASGRELTKSRLLLPGQVSLTGKARNALAPALEAFSRRDRSVMRQLEDTGRKPVDLDGPVVASDTGQWEQLVRPEAAEWYRNNYTYGITHWGARAWRSFEKTFSNATLVPSAPDSVNVYGRLVNQFMPKRQAQMATAMYSAAGPAERWVMTRQTLGGLLNTMNLRNTPEAQMIVERLTKGLVPTENTLKGYRAGGSEVYTTPDQNLIRVGDLQMPAAVHPWQAADGIELPNWRELRGLANRGAVLNTVTRLSNSHTANTLVQAWKASKVITWANAARQILEGATFLAWTDPKVFAATRSARKAVKADIKLRKVNDRDLERLSNHINHIPSDDLDLLEDVRVSDPGRFVGTVKTLLEKNGFNPGAAEVLARMGEDVDLRVFADELASKSEFRASYLAALGGHDLRVRTRMERMRRRHGDVIDSPWDDVLDRKLIEDMTMANARQLGNAADSYAWNTAERATNMERDRVIDAAGRGITFRPQKVVNAYEWLGAKGDANATQWAAELQRRMSDPIGALTLRAIAHRYLTHKGELERPKTRGETAIDLDDLAAERLTSRLYLEKVGPAVERHDATIELASKIEDLVAAQARGRKGTKAYIEREQKLESYGANADGGYGPTRAQVAAAKTERQRVADELSADPLVQPERFRNPDDLVDFLYGEHELGASARNMLARLQYLPDGTPALSAGDQLIARQHAARQAVDDLVHHLGGEVTRYTPLDGRPVAGRTEIRFGVGLDDPAAVDGFLAKVADGQTISADDLAKLPKAAYPEGLAVPIQAPMVPAKEGLTRGLSNLASRAYAKVVAEPLERLHSLPTFIANKRVAYEDVRPLMDALTERGLPAEHAAYLLEAAVNRRAIARTFNTTDNPAERTVFSEMADKWLMFERAQEDFLRRFSRAAQASPEGLARAVILVNGAEHAGIVHYEPQQDEAGNTEWRLTFTYPGTALAQRVLADAAVGLGLAPEEFLRVPQFNGLKSQVRFLNPSAANPISFSANPVFGLAIEAMEGVWPGAFVDLERIKRAMQGGQDFEGTEGAFSLKNMMPSMFSRFVPLMTQSDSDGQFQSAMRTALMYSELAGTTPDASASPAERDRFLTGVKATATNILIQRALMGLFAPAAPQADDPQDIEAGALAQAQGLPNLRSEFFDIRDEMNRKWPDNFIRAEAESVVEFARRYPGELIVNPSAFSTGSTKIEGVESGYVPYTIEATRWLTQNKEFVKANPQVAIALLPAGLGGDFSNEAYKLQLKSDLRTHKDIEEFYSDVVLSDDISEYYNTRSAFFTAAKQNTAGSKAVYARMDKWEDVWRRTHPLASAELDRRADPNFVHAEVAPSLERIASGVDQLPGNLSGLVPQIKEMHSDYMRYRELFQGVSYFDNATRARLNREFQRQGDVKWLATDVAGLWDLMRVTEGR